MFRSTDRHSRRVAYLKVGLPLFAGLLLSLVFLYSSKIDLTALTKYSEFEVNIDEIIAKQRISAPIFVGQSPEGVDVTLTAAYAEVVGGNPFLSDIVDIVDIDAYLSDADGQIFNFKSAYGRLDSIRNIATLSDGVRILISGGYDISTDNLRVDLNAGTAETNSPLTAQAPHGLLEAGKMKVILREDGRKMQFTKGVKLVYYFKDQRKAE